MRGDLRDDVMHPTNNRRKIDIGLLTTNAELVRIADRLCRVRRSQQRLRGNAAGVEAVAAHAMTFDQHGACTHLRRTGRNREPGRATADDANVSLDALGHSNVSHLAPRAIAADITARAPALRPRVPNGAVRRWASCA